MPQKKNKETAKQVAIKRIESNWKQKPLHGKFFERSLQADVDQLQTFKWLKSSSLRVETEGFILAAQDQSLKTKNYQCKIMKTIKDPNCRFCNKFQETIDHLVSGCPILALKEYLIRHNKVAKYIHWKLCQNYGIQVQENWYEHEPAPVMENNQATILWDFSIRTDKTIKANRPDIVVKNKNEKNNLTT